MEAVERALRSWPRERFLRDHDRSRAAFDGPLEIGHGQTNSQPRTVEAMLRLLDVRAGQHVLENSHRHRFPLAAGPGVLPAHNPLEFWELVHHLGDQIHLGQKRGPQGRGPLRLRETQTPRQVARQGVQPPGLLIQRPQRLLENHPL